MPNSSTLAPSDHWDGPGPGTLRRWQKLIPEWFATEARDLPWRRPDCTPWGVLVSEIMLQQTPVVRVLPRWEEWMRGWPAPADLAAAPTGDVLRAWDRLGYPRRALRLKEAAVAIAERHAGRVPEDEGELRALPGIGEYTAAAVAAFAHGRRSTVLDTNIRRVLARAARGEAAPPPALSRAEYRWAAALVPEDQAVSVRWNAGLMELGALVCTARSPRCTACPLAADCAWLEAGRPGAEAPTVRKQTWHGTDRQLRGAVLAVLRAGDAAVPRGLLVPGPEDTASVPESLSESQLEALARLRRLDPDPVRMDRIVAGLIGDRLAQENPEGLALPD